MQTNIDKNRKKRYIYDAILALSLIVVSLSALLIWRGITDRGRYACVSVGGEVVSEYSLSVDGEYELNGGSNILVIKGGEAYISHADCPDGLCVKTGKISLVGESIVCLPNKVSVRIS